MWLALLGALGCGSGASGSGGGVTSSAALAQGLAQAYCDWQARCCAPAEIQLLEGTSGDPNSGASSCSARALLAATVQLTPLSAAMNQALVTINSDAANACIAAYRDRPCNRPPIDPQSSVVSPTANEPVVDDALDACAGVFYGVVPVGARCDMSLECVPGARCVKEGLVSNAHQQLQSSGTLGVCFPNQPAGAPCTNSGYAADCDPSANLYCRGSDLTCATPAGEGEPCLTSTDGVEVIQCDAGKQLFCDPATHSCRHLPGANEPCIVPPDVTVPICDPDPGLALSCVGATIGGTGICKAFGAAGDACGGTGLPRCAVDLGCINISSTGIGTCGTPPGLGEPCGLDGVCASPGVCGSDAACGMPGSAPDGAGCPNGDGDCLSRLCVDGTCQPPQKWGARCVGASVTGARFLPTNGVPAP